MCVCAAVLLSRELPLTSLILTMLQSLCRVRAVVRQNPQSNRVLDGLGLGQDLRVVQAPWNHVALGLFFATYVSRKFHASGELVHLKPSASSTEMKVNIRFPQATCSIEVAVIVVSTAHYCTVSKAERQHHNRPHATSPPRYVEKPSIYIDFDYRAA